MTAIVGPEVASVAKQQAQFEVYEALRALKTAELTLGIRGARNKRYAEYLRRFELERQSAPHLRAVTLEQALTGQRGFVMYNAGSDDDPFAVPFTDDQLEESRRNVAAAKENLERAQRRFQKVAGDVRRPWEEAKESGRRYWTRRMVGRPPHPRYWAGDGLDPTDVLEWKGDGRLDRLIRTRRIVEVPSEVFES